MKTAGPVAEGEQASAPSSPEVIAPARHRFHFTSDGDLLSLVDRLRGFLRHKYPEGRLEEIFGEACRQLLARLESDRGPGAAARPATAPGSSDAKRRSRRVLAAVKREVWTRDQGRCSYVSPEGRRCESADALEYDHIVPWADGGRSDTTENIRLLCRAHNQRLGRKRFGGQGFETASRLRPRSGHFEPS